MKTVAMQTALKECAVNEAHALHRDQLFSALDQLNERIRELDTWLQQQAADNAQVQRLQTQVGVGLLTALAVVHGVGDVTRFTNVRQQVPAFVGLEPLEQSSGSKVKFGGISKKGSWLVRYLLGQAGHLAARHDPALKSFSKRLGKKKPKSVVKTAVARKLVVKLAIMLRDAHHSSGV
jgi:transposase